MNEQVLAATAENVVRTIPAVMRLVATELRQQNQQLVPTQLGTLSMLAHQSCNLSELAEQSGVSLPTMSSTISKMVAQGWVQRTRAEHDRRMIVIALTPDGRELLENMAQHIISRIAHMLSPLSDAELQDLAKGLAILQKIFPPFEPLHTPPSQE